MVDAMGGDFAPDEIVDGVLEAIKEYQVGVVLAGPEELLRQKLSAFDIEALGVEILDAPEIIGMAEHPGQAIRKKKNSSIVKGVRMVKEGQADAFVSAGNTGACMAASLFGYGRITGIDRPAIASVMPTDYGPVLLLDVGANADCKPQNLVQFAIMGQIYAEKILNIPKPSVGLLNIGEEEAKGNELSVATYQLLKADPSINFIGNIEGRDVFQGKANVVVCDGFVGNVFLKSAEGLANELMKMVKDAFSSSLLGKAGAALALPALKGLKKRLDYAEYGGAPLLGVSGVCIICHGSSKAKAIKNAIRVAKECVEKQVVTAIQYELEGKSSMGDELSNGV